MASNETTSTTVTTRPVADDDRAWIRDLLTERWGSPRVVTRGRVHDASALPGLVALVADRPVGLLTYRLDAQDCEVVTLDSLVERQGIGTALLQAAEHVARGAGARRLWLVTTNDNLSAIGFYQRRGWRLVAVHRGAVAHSRKLKPEIPALGRNGIAIRDELELERLV